MAFDSTAPVASSLVASAPVRSNFAAVPPSLFGANWVADPNFYIWPEETANGAAGQTVPPAHWILSGTGATVQRCGTGLTDTTVKDADDGFALALDSAAATAYIQQNLLEDDVPVMLQGQSIVYGAWVYATSSSVARLIVQDNDTGATYSSYHTGGSSWEWLTVIHEIGNGTAGLQVGLEVATGTNSAYIQGSTALLGDIKPTGYIPAMVVKGTYGIQYAGTPTAASYAPMKILPGAPFLFTGLGLVAYTTGTVLTAQVRKNTGSWVDMLSSNISKGSNIHVSSTALHSTYRRRCFRATWDAATTTQTDRIILAYVVTNTGAADLTFHVRGIQFSRPQDAMVNWQDTTKHGGDY
jgi:hypothetical protein